MHPKNVPTNHAEPQVTITLEVADTVHMFSIKVGVLLQAHQSKKPGHSMVCPGVPHASRLTTHPVEYEFFR